MRDFMDASPEVLEAVRRTCLIGAPTTEAGDDPWSWPLRPAIGLAKQTGSRLILADISTRSMWTTPYGSGGAGADRAAPYSDGTVASSRDELRLLGHDRLLEQLDHAQEAGVDAEMWLAEGPGVRALDRFLELFPIQVLIVPPFDEPTLADRIRGDEIDAIRRRMKNRILLIAHEDGTTYIDRG
jgi:hypothetical protein